MHRGWADVRPRVRANMTTTRSPTRSRHFVTCWRRREKRFVHLVPHRAVFMEEDWKLWGRRKRASHVLELHIRWKGDHRNDLERSNMGT